MIKSSSVIEDTLYCLLHEYKMIVHSGGTYAGKTFGILVALIYFLAKKKDANLKVRIIGQSVPELENGAHKDWRAICDLLPIAKLESKQAKTYKIGTNLIKFMSVDTLGKAKSGKWDITFINEANHIDWEIADQLLLKSNIKIIDFNPTGRFWLHKHILPKIDIYEPYLLKRTTYKDNPSISEDKIREIESITDPSKRAAYVEGRLAQNPAAIFTEWSTFTGNFPEGNYHMYHLDFGFTNDVTALGEICMYSGEVYCMEWIYETGLLTKQLHEKMQQLGIRRDIPIIADNIPKDIAELRAYGWKIIPAIKPKVVQRVSLMQEYKYNVHIGSENYQSELEQYKFLKDRRTGEFTNIPEDRNNHLLDGMGYWGWWNLRSKAGALSKAVGVHNIM
jgi:phage terminase large subunit